ncbi:hypothetical protein CY34DRAFT_89506 [Suillus luteus UH-Slu-Lm8-n1]|uniref:Uncharacterized protein n=1 Tax=Suillus luteus UH-Slu-Lm8-n1 TaxID=930992 RepID=A0A0D0ABY7_9AGAM|nr:hypothetical protein CY34DRAFT_89506 [Suillus luteus UH-Slu-Lm8-n1]
MNDGVVQLLNECNWWKWMYRVSPFTYIIEGLLGQGRCPSIETVSVNPPKSLTCSKYMDPFMEFAGGYFTNPESAEGCQYCPAKTTDQFMHSSVDFKYSNH